MEITEADKLMTEADLATWLEDLLERFNWLWYHSRPGRVIRGGRDVYETAYTGHKGWFDYIAIRGARFVVIEIKSQKGKLSPEQKDWHDAIDLLNRLRIKKGYKNPIEKYLVRPSDREFIQELLK